MPIRDLAARNASLNNDYGATRGPNAPDAHSLALFSGDPMIDAGDGGGVEISGGGYARVTIDQSEWLPAADGLKTLAAPKTFPATTGEWPDTVTHWALYDGSTMWDCGPLAEEVDVTGAGAGPVVNVTVFYDDDTQNQEGDY